MTDYIPEGSCGDCGQALPESLCDLIAELTAMKDRINEMITQVQGIGPDAQGHVHLPFSEDIADSTLGVSGTFAGGHAVLQVKDIADHASETADNAQDIAQIAADAANSASQSASGALSKATEADLKAQQASADAGLALAAAEDAQAAVGNSVMDIGPSVAEETQVRVPYTLKDGTQGAFLVPAVDPDSAGVITPGQMADLGHQLDSLGGEIDGVKAEYLRRHAIHDEQDITGRVNFKISPFVPVLKPNEYADHNGTRAYNPASAAADPALLKTAGKQESSAEIINLRGPFSAKSTTYDRSKPKADTGQNIVQVAKAYDKNGKEVSIIQAIQRGYESALELMLFAPKDDQGTIKAYILKMTVDATSHKVNLFLDGKKVNQ